MRRVFPPPQLRHGQRQIIHPRCRPVANRRAPGLSHDRLLRPADHHVRAQRRQRPTGNVQQQHRTQRIFGQGAIRPLRHLAAPKVPVRLRQPLAHLEAVGAPRHQLLAHFFARPLAAIKARDHIAQRQHFAHQHAGRVGDAIDADRRHEAHLRGPEQRLAHLGLPPQLRLGRGIRQRAVHPHIARRQRRRIGRRLDRLAELVLPDGHHQRVVDRLRGRMRLNLHRHQVVLRVQIRVPEDRRVRAGQIDRFAQHGRVIALGGRTLDLQQPLGQLRGGALLVRVRIRRHFGRRRVHRQRRGNASDKVVAFVGGLRGRLRSERRAHHVAIALIVLNHPHAAHAGPQQLVAALLGFALARGAVLALPQLEHRLLDARRVGLGQIPPTVLPRRVHRPLPLGRLITQDAVDLGPRVRRRRVAHCVRTRHTNSPSTRAPWRISRTMSAGVFPARSRACARWKLALCSSRSPNA